MRAKQKTATVPKTTAASGIPVVDIDRCAATASSMQTAANTAARAVGANSGGPWRRHHRTAARAVSVPLPCRPNRSGVQDNALI